MKSPFHETQRILHSSYDLGSDGFESPGSLLGQPGFHFLPYGVRTPDSIMSTGSRGGFSANSGYGSGYGMGWKLPDKLRIVKPLEGSLTLHNWQRLAKPHLGSALEERSGVAVKGGLGVKRASAGLGGLSDFDEEEEDDDELLDSEVSRWMHQKPDPTRTQMTFTNSTVLHPDTETQMTSTYDGVQLSSGFLRRPATFEAGLQPVHTLRLL